MCRNIRTLWRIAAAALALVIAPCVLADAIDDYVREQMRQLRFPGMAVTVIRNGQVVTTRTYGSANLELDVPVTPDTVFELGSLSKQFTAFAILLLVEEKKVALDDSIAKYLPQVPASWRGITVRHLLTHSSGIQEYLSVEGLPDEAHAATHDAMTKLFGERLKLEFAPGESWAYSNSGYLTLGNLIERVSGKSYWDFLRERIFVPFGMTATRSTEPRAVIPRRASGYGWRNGSFENRAALSENAYAAGAIVSTIRDMAKWDAALHARKLLSQASYDAMWTPVTVSLAGGPPFSYAFGWVADFENGRKVVLHSGGTPGFSTAIRRYVDDGVTVIVLANRGDRLTDHIAAEIAHIAVPELARGAVVDPEPQITARVTAALRDLLAGKADPKLYTPAMQVFLTTATGHGLPEWIASHGELQSLTYAGRDGHTRRYRVRLGEVQSTMSVTLAETGEIAQVYWW